MQQYPTPILNNKGFTLIELVVVILILAALVVSVSPSINSDGFSADTEQDQIMALLRNVQTRAMQNTQDSSCQGVYITTTNIGLATQNNDGSCANSFAVNATATNNFLNLTLENTFTVQDADGNALTFFEFGDLGRPYNASGTNISVIITIDATQSVCIESEGYVHEC